MVAEIGALTGFRSVVQVGLQHKRNTVHSMQLAVSFDTFYVFGRAMRGKTIV